MKGILRFAILMLVIFASCVSPADAEKKKTAKQKAIDKCDARHALCMAKCDDLIDINNQIRDCNDKCTVRQSYCLLRAGVLEQTPGGTGSEQSPGALKAQ